jgi:hypothetical protein
MVTMTETLLTHDAGVSAFEDAGGVVSTDDDDGISFHWDEKHVVRVDAPSDLQGAFDTDRFYKVEDATIARPIKQAYLVGDDIEWYKKPADELRKAAWSFDNKPFTLGHPDTGMVKDVSDIHGFWRNVHYVDDEDRLNADLYVPANDDEALDWLEGHSDVSVGFYNRVHSDYDGDTGDLTDDDVDGFQVDMYGNHVAGVKQGRCSGEDGCGLDDQSHGEVVADASTVFERERGMTENEEMFSEGDRVKWAADAIVAHNPEDEDGVMIEILDRDGNSTEMVTTVSTDSIWHDMATDKPTVDAPDGIYVADDGTWLAVAPSEHPDDNTEHPDDGKFPVDSCSDVDDAWGLRGHTDSIDISKETLGNRIQRAARAMDCDVPGESEEASGSTDSDSTESCGCGNMTDNESNDTDGFDVPDLSVDAIAEKNSDVQELKEERDTLRENLDEMEETLESAFDSAEHFSVEIGEDECPCEAVDDLVADLDEKAAEVEDLRDELSEYRQDEIEERLDTLEDLGAERDEWKETADEADSPLDVLDEEIERREEVLEAADADMSVKDIDASTDEDATEDDDRTVDGSRSFGRGHNA